MRLAPLYDAIDRLRRALGMPPGPAEAAIDKATLELMRLRDLVARAALPLEGCGDHSCIIQSPKGMATNGGCRCDEFALRRAVRLLKARDVVVELPKTTGM